MLIIKHDYCGRYIDCDCVCQNGAWLTGECTDTACCTQSIGYLLGKDTPHYPVPAIPVIIAADPHNNCTWIMRDDDSEMILDCCA